MITLKHALTLLTFLAVLSSAACTSAGHASSDTVTICTRCYEQVREARASGRRARRNEIVRIHACPDCASDVSIYEQDGELRIRCASCAPEGAACDACRPVAGDR